MTLADRTAAEHFKAEQFPRLKQQLDATAGFPVPLDVAWDTLAVEGYGHLYAEGWTKVFFEPLRLAFAALGADAAEREALRVGLKEVVLCNRSGHYTGRTMVEFEAGVLTLDHEPGSNLEDIHERADAIRAALEKVLSGDADAPAPRREEEQARVLAALRARNPIAILGEMAALQRRARAGELVSVPVLTLHLSTGREVRGFVLDVSSTERDGHWVLVHEAEGADRRVDVTYLAVASVIAVTVHDVSSLDRAPPDAPPPPERRTVRRHVAELQERLRTLVGSELALEVEWKGFPPGEPLRGLDETLTLVERVLTGVAQEPLGREAVRESVARLHFLPGERTEVRRDGSQLLVRVGLSPRGRVPETELKRAMEMLL